MENARLSEKKWYGRRLLIFGLTCVVLSIYFFLPDLLTRKKSLMQVNGSVIYSNLVVEEVSNNSRFGLKSTSRRATLAFMLDGQSALFLLRENIGTDYEHPEYKKLLKRLRAAKQVVVWIKPSEEKIHTPKVFQIDIDNKTHLDFETIKCKNAWVFVFLITIGLLSVAVVLRRYPRKN